MRDDRSAPDLVPVPRSDARSGARRVRARPYEKRLSWITDDMRSSARAHGCLFHRAWHAADGSAFYAVACWQTREGARAIFTEWQIDDEEGEVAIRLEGDVGLVPVV